MIEYMQAGPKGIVLFSRLCGIPTTPTKSWDFYLVGVEWTHDHFRLDLRFDGGAKAEMFLVPTREKRCFSKSSHINICYTGPKTYRPENIESVAVRLRGTTLGMLTERLGAEPDTKCLQSDNSGYPRYVTAETIKAGRSGLDMISGLIGVSTEKKGATRYILTAAEWRFDHFLLEIQEGASCTWHALVAHNNTGEFGVCTVKVASNDGMEISGIPALDAALMESLGRINLEKLANALLAVCDTVVRLPYAVSKITDGSYCLQLNINSKCAWNCTFCSYVKNLPVSVRPLPETMETSVREIKELNFNIKTIYLAGNDILTRDGIETAIRMLKNFNCRMVIDTVSEKINDDGFFAAIKDISHLLLFDLPIYGACAQTHDKIAGAPGSFDYITRAFEEKRLPIRTHTIFLRENLSEMPQLRKHCEDRGVSLRYMVLAQMPSENGLEIYKRNAVKYSEIKNALKIIFPAQKNRGMFHLMKSFSRYIPACIAVPESKAQFELENDGNFWLRLELDNPCLVKCRHVSACRSGGDCPGIFNGYLDLFGDSEFVPIR